MSTTQPPREDSELESSDRALFNRVAEKYCSKDLAKAARIARKHRLLQTLGPLNLGSDIDVLEIGCGGGFSPGYLRGRYRRFVGVDYAEDLIQYAKAHNAGPDVSYQAINVKDYDVDQRFDVIFMIGVLHHFDEPQATLEHISGMLNPGGWLVANEPSSTNLGIQLMRKIRGRLDPAYSPDQLQFSAPELRFMYEKAGLVNVRLTPQGLFSTPLAEVVMEPALLFGPLSSLCVLMDRVLESIPGMWLSKLSWNLIAGGQRPDTGRRESASPR